MKYFVIHSGLDWKKSVEQLIQSWTIQCNDAQFIVLNGKQSDWIGDATAKIRQADKIIYIVGETSHKSENIDLEITIALKEKKQIFIYKLNDEYALNKCLEPLVQSKNKMKGDVEGEIVYTLHRNPIILLDSSSIVDFLQTDINESLEGLPAKNFKDMNQLLEQYKLFVETSEALVKRKQTVNSFYVTLNSFLLGAVITVISASNDLPILFGYIKTSSLVSIFTSLIGFVVCFSWISLLSSYADLNSSKMKIIGWIEKNLAVNLYDTEWAVMTQKVGKRKYKSFSKKEMLVAFLFGILYILMLILGIVLAFIK